MRYRIFFCLALLLLCGTVSAQEDIVAAAPDSLTVADSVLSDEDLLKMLSAESQKDTVAKKIDRGHDVSSLINARRYRAVDLTPFEAKPFFANTFASLRASSLVMSGADYSTGILGGLSFGKWFHQDHAARINLEIGGWRDNFDRSAIVGTELSATYLFNLTSYAFGYRTNRFCEIMILGGAGYANSTVRRPSDSQIAGTSGDAFTCHAGVQLNLRVFKNVDFFLEPQGVIYSNGMAVSYAGHWRSWMAAFRGTFGLTYNIRQSYLNDSPRLKTRQDGYFVSLMGGPHFQNSAAVYDVVGLGDALGVQIALGVGKYYTDYFAMRYSASYSRGKWIEYSGKYLHSNYFALRAEGMFDVVGFICDCVSESKREKQPVFAASVLFGPEFGYMYKVDLEEVVSDLYIGLSAGVQAKVRLTPRFSLFVEPRFSIVPYDAPNHSLTTLNEGRNYYDGILNFNLGVEYAL